MRKALRREFGVLRPRAIVLDDSARARIATARRLRRNGFDVVECSNAAQFFGEWKPGTVDVIIADWQLSHKETELGDRVLAEVRKRDWDVPFVLVSGRLSEDGEQRARVLEHLLASGSAKFIQRGSGAIEHACDIAEDLIERRDLALLKLVLSMREAVLAGATLKTSSGEQPVEKILESIVSKPQSSRDADRPIAERHAKKILGEG